MGQSRFSVKWREFTSVLANEYKFIFHDAGVILVGVFALIIYATLYSLAYSKQVVRNVPIAVVDNSHTASSRRLIELFDAAPNLFVSYTPADMEEAKALFYDRKVYGVVYIPYDYERKLMRGEQVVVGVYADASYFLIYRQVFSDVVAGLTGTGSEVEFTRLLAKGATIPQAEATTEPVVLQTTNLFNPYLGYGTFIMPAIIIIIIQQTLLIAIGMMGGTWREHGLYRTLIQPGEMRLSVVPVVLGKAVAYFSIYCITGLYALGFHYKAFGYPMHAPFLHIVLFMAPYLLSCIFLGIAVSTLFRYRENSILFMLWSSIPILLVSGASLPKEALPEWLYNFGRILPSSNGVEGFLRLQTMGASLQDVASQINMLWILTAVYFVLACCSIRYIMRREAAGKL